MGRNIAAMVVAIALAPLAAGAVETRQEGMLEFTPVKRPTFNIMGDLGLNAYNLSLNALTEPGVAYGARMDLNATRNITVELSYQGALNGVRTHYSPNGDVITNQIGGAFRVNFLPGSYDLAGRLTPYIFGGVAYHGITTQNFTPGISNANAIAVPLGAGVEVDANSRIIVGARFTYNLLFNEANSFAGGDADSWAATVNLGARLTQ